MAHFDPGNVKFIDSEDVLQKMLDEFPDDCVERDAIMSRLHELKVNEKRKSIQLLERAIELDRIERAEKAVEKA